MLFNYEKLDKFDSSEDCLIGKVLLGLIFNPFVPGKRIEDYRLAREFLKYYLDEKEIHDLDFSKAEILFKPKYSWFNTDKMESDKTEPDLLLLFPEKAIIAFEVKYTLPIDNKLVQQLKRENKGLEVLKDKEESRAEKKYIFLLVTHQRLFRQGTSFKKIRQCYDDFGDEFRVNTWNCVYKVVQDVDAKYLPNKKEILDFLEQKENYMTNPLDGRKKDLVKLISFECDKLPWYRWDELRDRINAKISMAPDKPNGGLKIFAPYRDLAEKIIEMSDLNLQERSKYINLRNERVKAQLHPSPCGVDLAIREADEDVNLPKCNILHNTPIQSLHGYWGANKDWLEGNGKRFTERRAAAFHIPGEMENNPKHPGWEQVEALLAYAREKDC